MRALIRDVVAAGMLVVAPGNATACTTFCIRIGEDLVVGKNLDFYTGSGQVAVNKTRSQKVFSTVDFLKDVPESGILQASRYPQSMKCSKE